VRFDTGVVFEFFRRLGEGAGAGPGEAAAPEERLEPGAQPGPAGGPSPAAREELRFVLALLLIRKKALSLLGSGQRDGCEWLQVAEKGAPGRAYWIRNPGLSGPQLERIKVEVGDLLAMHV
jgi:hypothetical protein